MQVIRTSGVLMDVCPECRGVWFDHGEMEKLLSEMRRIEREYEEEREEHRRDRKKPYRKKSSLARLLDVFD